MACCGGGEWRRRMPWRGRSGRGATAVGDLVCLGWSSSPRLTPPSPHASHIRRLNPHTYTPTPTAITALCPAGNSGLLVGATASPEAIYVWDVANLQTPILGATPAPPLLHTIDMHGWVGGRSGGGGCATLFVWTRGLSVGSI